MRTESANRPFSGLTAAAACAAALLTACAGPLSGPNGPNAQSAPSAPAYINPGLGQGMPFSEGVRHGPTYYLSGQLGVDRSTGRLVTGGMKAEARQTMENIKGALLRQNLTMNDLVKCTVMLVDMSEWADFNGVYASYFNARQLPARSALGVSALALGARVEVECQAALR